MMCLDKSDGLKDTYKNRNSGALKSKIIVEEKDFIASSTAIKRK
jgi:hypothetical protein